MVEKVQTRRGLLKSLTVVALVPAVCSFVLGQSAPARRPNFVLIIGDDISIDDFGCYGHPRIRTPNIDKLAANGLRFTNAYLTTSSCSPTRCSVISGRYPHNTGAPELHMPLPEGQPMFPRFLKESGYHTVAAGKWHLGSYAERAFHAISESYPGGEENWLTCLRERPIGKPFLMWFASHDAHRPWQPDKGRKPHQPADAVVPPYMADLPNTRKDIALYNDEVQRLDYYVGLVVKELEQQKVLDNTFILFMADNGRPFPRCKTWLYDSGIKTPFIVYWPKGIANPGKVSHSLISAIDIAPTILTLAGIQPPPSMQGGDFSALLNEPSKEIRRYAFAEHNWHDQAVHERMVRWKDYVYIRNAHPELDNLVAGHRDRPSYVDLLHLREQGKLTPAQNDIFLVPRPAEALFHVSSDPHQLHNLVGRTVHKEALTHLRRIMDEWQRRTGDTVPKQWTPDRYDRRTGEQLIEAWAPPRGVIPGSERDAQKIIDPGPR